MSNFEEYANAKGFYRSEPKVPLSPIEFDEWEKSSHSMWVSSWRTPYIDYRFEAFRHIDKTWSWRVYIEDEGQVGKPLYCSTDWTDQRIGGAGFQIDFCLSLVELAIHEWYVGSY